MGNTVRNAMAILPGPVSYYKQEDSGFTYLPEDMLIALVEYFDLKDFIALITTCKYYNYEFIGQTNILWGHICRSIGKINFIIRSIQFGRRWKIDGQTADLNKAIDLTDRDVVAAFNFREIVEEYYLRILHKASLRSVVQDLTIAKLQFVNFLITVEIEQYSPNKIKSYWTTDLSNKRFRQDYFFVVDLDFDPSRVDEIIDGRLPYSKGGRLVAYKKSKKDPVPHIAKLDSRAEMERRFRVQMLRYQQQQQQQQEGGESQENVM